MEWPSQASPSQMVHTGWSTQAEQKAQLFVGLILWLHFVTGALGVYSACATAAFLKWFHLENFV